MDLLYVRNHRLLQVAVAKCIATLFSVIIVDAVFAQSEQTDAPLSTSEIAHRVIPTVVTIKTPNRHGSGVIVDPSGVVVTNLHVIEGKTTVELALHNGDIYDDVAVVDFDVRRDLVLLKIKAFGISTASLGDSEKVKVGERVILVGSPEGFDSTVSDGVVSAIRDSENGYRLIQTTAPASSGSSGGGMFNTNGELIGIVTSQAREGQNLNFAIPINYVRGLISSEATMTLTDLAEREQSNYDDESDRTNSTSAVTDVESDTTHKLGAIIDTLRVLFANQEFRNEVGGMSLEFTEADKGEWYAVFEGGSRLDGVRVFVNHFKDEFDDGILVISSILPKLDADLTPTQLKEILELSLYLNFAKVFLDNDGSVGTMVEAELRILDSVGLFRTIYAVADANQRVSNKLNHTTEKLTALLSSRQSGDEALGLLDGHIAVHYNPQEWEENPSDAARLGASFILYHLSNEVLVVVNAERMQIPADRVPEQVIDDIRESYQDARIVRRGSRTVNGIEVTYWEHSATVDGVKYMYLGHAYSNSNGTIQIIGGTTPNLFEEHRSTIEKFVAGLEVSPP